MESAPENEVDVLSDKLLYALLERDAPTQESTLKALHDYFEMEVDGLVDPRVFIEWLKTNVLLGALDYLGEAVAVVQSDEGTEDEVTLSDEVSEHGDITASQKSSGRVGIVDLSALPGYIGFHGDGAVLKIKKWGNSDDIGFLLEALSVLIGRSEFVPLEKRIGELACLTSRKAKKVLLNALQEEKRELAEIVPRCVDAVMEVLKKNPNANTPDVIGELQEQDFFMQANPAIRASIIEIFVKRVRKYVAQRNKISKYKRDYENNSAGLLSKLSGIDTKKITGEVSLLWSPHSVTFVIEDDSLFDILNTHPNAEDVLGFAHSSGFNVARKRSHAEVRQILAHEERHQRNWFLLRDGKRTPAVAAQDEIIAYTEDGSSARATIELLTERGDVYDYYSEDREKAMKDGGDFVAVEKAWMLHCQRVAQAVATARAIPNVNLDTLAMTQMNEWRGLLPKKTAVPGFVAEARYTGKPLEGISVTLELIKTRIANELPKLGRPWELSDLPTLYQKISAGLPCINGISYPMDNSGAGCLDICIQFEKSNGKPRDVWFLVTLIPPFEQTWNDIRALERSTEEPHGEDGQEFADAI